MYALVAFTAVSVVLAYVFLVRPVLVQSPVLSKAFKEEAAFMDKVRAKITGMKTKLAARFVMLASVLVSMYDVALPYATGQDWTPLTHRLPDWAWPCIVFGLGFVFNWLRHVTENPPQVVTQKMDDGSVQVVAVNKPAS